MVVVVVVSLIAKSFIQYLDLFENLIQSKPIQAIWNGNKNSNFAFLHTIIKIKSIFNSCRMAVYYYVCICHCHRLIFYSLSLFFVVLRFEKSWIWLSGTCNRPLFSSQLETKCTILIVCARFILRKFTHTYTSSELIKN